MADPRPSLLLVDDDALYRERLAKAMSARGYEVRTAAGADRRLHRERRVAVDEPQRVGVDAGGPAHVAGLPLPHAEGEPGHEQDDPLHDEPDHGSGDADEEEHEVVRDRGELPQDEPAAERRVVEVEAVVAGCPRRGV